MNTPTLDCRGLDCPGPVLRCLECLDKEAPLALTVLLDDPGALENVARLLTGKGYAVASVQDMGTWTLSASRAAESVQTPARPASGQTGAGPDAPGKTVVFLTAETLGAGSDELGGKLMLNFLATLPELGPALWRVILVNGAVKLATQAHPCLEKLEALAASGVGILVCGTCLGFFGLAEHKRVGETTNMLDVVTSLATAAKVIQA